MTEIDVRPARTLQDVNGPDDPNGAFSRPGDRAKPRIGAAMFGSAALLLLLGGLAAGLSDDEPPRAA